MAETQLDFYGGYRAIRDRDRLAREQAVANAASALALNELTRDRTVGEVAADTGVGLLQGAVNLGEAGYGLGNLLTFGTLERGLGLADNFQRTREILQQAKSPQLQYAALQNQRTFDERGILAGVYDYVTNPSLMMDLAATQVPSVLPAAAAGTYAAGRVLGGAAARGLGTQAVTTAANKAAARAAVVAGGAQMGGTAYSNIYNQAIEEGLSEEEANKRALLGGYATGVVGAAISTLPGVGAAGVEGAAAARAVGVPQAATSAARTVAQSAGREATEEYLQSGAEQLIQNVASERRTLMEGVAQNAAMGAVGGGLLGASMGTIPATSNLRSDITNIMNEAAAEAGVEDIAKTELERQGEQQLQQEAAAQREADSIIQMATERLTSLGFVANDDGTFSRPGDPLYGDQTLTLDEALDIAAEEDIVAETLPSEADFPVADLPQVEEAPSAEEIAASLPPVPEVEETPIPLPEVEEEQVGYRAYQKANNLLAQSGATRVVRDGKVVFKTEGVEDGVPTTIELDEATGIEVARQMGVITDNEAAEALRYAELLAERRTDPTAPPVEPPRSQTPITEDTVLKASDVMEQEEYRRQEATLREAGYFPDEDGTYWKLDDELGKPRGLSREDALAEMGYVPEGKDLLGDPLFTPVSLPEPDENYPSTPINQLFMPGIDPEYDAERRQRGMEALREAAKTPPLLEAPEGQDIRDAWSEVFNGAVEAYNAKVPDDRKINFNAAMRRSALLRDFVEGAVENGIQPGSPESFDYVMEKAKEAEAEGVKAASVIAAVADLAGAVEPGSAPLSRWRKALARRGIAKPGQMRGPAYVAFKEVVSKAAITPSSPEFDTFMGAFSDSLTDEQADTPFGKAIRKAYPKSKSPAEAKEAKTRQVAEAKQTTKKPRKRKKADVAPSVAKVSKTGEEKALTEPTPVAPEKGQDTPINAAKRAVRQTLNEVAPEADQTVREAEADIQRVRNESLLVDDEPTGEVDPDVVAAEREAQRLARRQIQSDEAVEAVNAAVYEVQQRISRLSDRFSEAVSTLRARYVEAGTKNAREATQSALSDVIGSRLRALDKALLKDAGDIATWGGLVGTVVSNDEFNTYADGSLAYDDFIEPALERFSGFIEDATTADGVRIYRAVMQETGLEEYVNTKMRGKAKAKAQKALADLHQMMDAKIDRMTGDPANAQNVHPFKTNKAKYSTAPEGVAAAAPMDRAELDEIVNTWNLNRPDGAIAFDVYSTVDEAQNALGIAIPSAANGVYYNGRAAVIAENVPNEQVAQEVILHERTHGGLEALLEDRLPAVMNRLWANPQLRRRIQARMRVHNETRIQAAEEVLVDMVVNGERLNKNIFSKIRAAISRLADRVFGITDYVAPDSMVNELLRDTADYLRGAKSGLSLSETYINGLDAYAAVFEGNTVPRSPMFSVVGEELQKLAAGDVSDVAALQEKYQKALSESMANNWQDKAKGTVSSIAGEVGRITMDLLPASQIADLNRGLFWDNETQTDLLKQFVEDKMDKEHEFNKVIQRKRKMFYAGPDGHFDFEESIMNIADDWSKLTTDSRKASQVTAMNKVNQLGTFYKIYPDRTWDQQTKLDYSKENFTEADRRRAYADIRRSWESMDDTTKQLYRRVQAAYASLWSERMQELRNQTKRIAEASTTMPDPDAPGRDITAREWLRKMDAKISLAIGRIKQGPYSPLQRFGDYYVVVRDPEGNVVFSSGHDTEADARAMEKAMRDGLQEGYTITTSQRTEHFMELGGINQQQYNQIQAALANAFPNETESDQLARKQALAALEEVMLHSLPDHSLLKHANTRKGIAGATPDAFRAFSDYAIKSARNLAAMRYDHRIQGALGEMRKFAGSKDNTALNLKRAKVFNAIQRQHLESQRVKISPYSSYATSVGFLMYMTSPSQMALNASQTALVTMPMLAARYGVGEVMRYMKEATSGFVRSKARGMHSDRSPLDPNSAVARVLQNLHSIGTLDFTQSYDLSDMAQRESDLMHSRWRAVTHAASTFMRLSEIYNREVAAYIAVRGEMRKAGVTDEQFRQLPQAQQEELLDQWTRVARDAVSETQFIYNQSNKGRLLQGNVARVVGQFQQFRINMLALIARYTRDAVFGVNDPSLSVAERRARTRLARVTLAYMTVTQLALTGAASSILAPVAFALMDLFRDDDDLLSAEEKFMQAAPTWISMGLLGQFLDPQRFGFNSLVPILGGSRYIPAGGDPQDKLDHFLLDSLGPIYGITSQALRGLDMISNGDAVRGVSYLMPKVMSDAYKVLVSEGRDMADSRGYAWYERTDWDMFANAIGLKTGDQAVAQADRSAIYSGVARATDRRTRLLFRYVSAEDPEEANAAFEEIAKWNRRWGSDSSLAITRSTLKRAAKTHAERQRNAAETGVPSTRVPEAIRRMVDAGG